MAPLELIQLPVLMALLDGPVVTQHPDLLRERIRDTLRGRVVDAAELAAASVSTGRS
jgi:hypothetical protein